MATDYALAKVEDLLPADVAWEDLKDNLEDLGDDVPIPKISFNSSEAAFYLNEDDEDEEPTKEFDGVILAYHRQNTYWASGYDANDRSPPECVSLDNKTGTVYGDCKSCAYNQFGSAPVGKGKACRNQIKLYIQLDGRAIPQKLFLSPANLKAFTSAFMVGQVSQMGQAYWKVKAKFTAYKVKKETFGRIKLAVIGIFKGEELENIKSMRDFWLPIIQGDHYSAANFNSSSDSDTDTETESAGHITTNEDVVDMSFDTPEESANNNANNNTSNVAEAPEPEPAAKPAAKPATKVKPKSKKVEIDAPDDDDDDVPF